MDDIIIRYVDMPTKIHGYTTLDDNGDYNVYINDRLSHDQRQLAYDHEMAHINEGHFYAAVDVQDIELAKPPASVLHVADPEPVYIHGDSCDCSYCVFLRAEEYKRKRERVRKYINEYKIRFYSLVAFERMDITPEERKWLRAYLKRNGKWLNA